MHAIVDQLAAIYDESVANLREALAAYVEDRTAPGARARAKGIFAYPELRIDYAGKLPRPQLARALLGEEAVERLVRPVEHHRDVLVARRPRVAQQRA
jgi:hypothetical protein